MRSVFLAVLLMSLVAGVSACPGCGAGWEIYRNEICGFELYYPAGGVVAWQTHTGARIDLPFAPGTTLREKYLLIEVGAGAADLPSPPAEAVEVCGRTFYLEAGWEGAVGSIYDYFRYTTVLENGELISLTFVLHSVNPCMFDSPPLAFDREQETAVFQEIILSFCTFPGRRVDRGRPSRPSPVAWMEWGKGEASS